VGAERIQHELSRSGLRLDGPARLLRTGKFQQTGVETTIVGDVRVRRLLFNTNLDLFGDFDEFEDPTLDWRNTFSFRLTSALSVDYRVDILEQPQVTDETGHAESLVQILLGQLIPCAGGPRAPEGASPLAL
jgi:hypothetical protein